MAVTREFGEAVLQCNLLRVKIMLKDSLLVDTSFNQFEEMIRYAEPRLRELWVSDEEDEEDFSSSPEELNAILAGLVNHFSRRRVAHLKGLISRAYPSKPRPQVQQQPRQHSTTYRETATVIKQTDEIKREYSGIRDDRKAIANTCSRIKDKNQMDTSDLAAIRKAAASIVAHCDKIMGRQV